MPLPQLIVNKLIERKEEMQSMRSNRLTLQTIADKFGISRERVRQVIGNTSDRVRGKSKGRNNIIGGTSKSGSEGELIVSHKLSGHGIHHKLMSYHHPYDIQLDNGLRVEVKASSQVRQKDIVSPFYKFSTGATKGDYTDFMAFVLLDTKEVFIVPFSRVKSASKFSFVWPKVNHQGSALDMSQYYNRFDLLK